jgi:hypothetical protein
MFTSKQLQDFAAYKAVQMSGQINMWDVLNGCRLSGLTRDEYMFVLENYKGLRESKEETPMKIHSEYHFEGIKGTYPADPPDVITVLYEFDTEEEMNTSGLLHDKRRTTCFMSAGKYYVGGHFKPTENAVTGRVTQ